MRPILNPALPLRAAEPWLGGDAAVAERVRMVLETQPGTLPWRPDFGCDLGGLVGQPATRARLGEVRWRVEQALRRWIPEVRVARCHVDAVSLRAGNTGFGPGVPLAEGALLALGTQVALDVSVDLETPQGPLLLTAQLMGSLATGRS